MNWPPSLRDMVGGGDRDRWVMLRITISRGDGGEIERSRRAARRTVSWRKPDRRLLRARSVRGNDLDVRFGRGSGAGFRRILRLWLRLQLRILAPARASAGETPRQGSRQEPGRRYPEGAVANLHFHRSAETAPLQRRRTCRRYVRGDRRAEPADAAGRVQRHPEAGFPPL